MAVIETNESLKHLHCDQPSLLKQDRKPWINISLLPNLMALHIISKYNLTLYPAELDSDIDSYLHIALHTRLGLLLHFPVNMRLLPAIPPALYCINHWSLWAPNIPSVWRMLVDYLLYKLETVMINRFLYVPSISLKIRQ